MVLLHQLKNNSSTVFIRTKEEINHLFSEMASQKLPIDNNLDFKIRMSIQKVKLQLYYELKLAEYRRTVNSSKKTSVGDSTLEKTKDNKQNDKGKNNNKLASIPKEKKQKVSSESTKVLPHYAFITVRTNSDVDDIVSFFKDNKSELNSITDYWIRLNIINKEILSYYKNSMSKSFDNYHKMSEGLKGGRLSRLVIRNKKTIEGFHKRFDQYKNKVLSAENKPKPIKEEKKKVSFAYLKKKEWILDWNCVMFKRGSVVVYSRSDLNVKFRPTTVYIKDSLESFNYLKKYLNERLPPVRCEIVGLELRIIDEIHFNEAIQQFAIAARQGVIKVKRSASNVNVSPLPMSFSQAMSKAKQMTPEEFKKYKSKYIDYLVAEQSKDYKIVPCAERLAHTTGDTTEFAFLFSIPCGNDKVMIVHENVNPDRSTLLFLVRKEEFQKSIRAIYDFLQSAEINKRSSLRSRDLEIDSAKILRYKSINHDDYSSWKQTILFYKKYYWG